MQPSVAAPGDERQGGDDGRPLLFVAMPFGSKRDPTGRITPTR